MFGRLALAALCALGPLSVSAQVPEDVAEVTILSGWREEGGRHVAGLSVDLAPGWKTYWRAPGDGGIPPVFNWSGSSNIAALDVHFPVPSVFRQNGLRSIGYSDRVVFPLLIETGAADVPVRLKGEVEMGICQDICIPVSFRFDATLLPGGAKSPDLLSALNDRPEAGGDIDCDIAPIADGLQLAVTTLMPPMGGEEFAVIEAGEVGLWISEADVSRDGSQFRAEVEMVPPSAKPFALARSEVRLTVLSNGRAVEMTGCD